MLRRRKVEASPFPGMRSVPKITAKALVQPLMWTSALLFCIALSIAIAAHGQAQGWVTLFGRLSAASALAAVAAFARAVLDSRKKA